MVVSISEGVKILFITLIFLTVAWLFLFPNNRFLPLDRRIAGLLGAGLCTVVNWSFESSYHPSPGNEVSEEDKIPISIDPGGFIDVPVLIILISIMVINFVIMRQKVLVREIARLQSCIRNDIDMGYWFVCLAAFLSSPFITNDGLCLLIVDPVLDAFLIPADSNPPPISKPSIISMGGSSNPPKRNIDIYEELQRRDHKSNRFFYMLGIACSANIGSAMTFTGNPQNIIIASYLDKLMSGGMFFALMIPPATISWFITCYYINSIRKRTVDDKVLQVIIKDKTDDEVRKSRNSFTVLKQGLLLADEILEAGFNTHLNHDVQDVPTEETAEKIPFPPPMEELNSANIVTSKMAEEIGSYSWIAFPFFSILIILELIGIFSLVALFAFVAIYLVVSVMLVNYYSGRPTHWPNGLVMTNRERIQLIIKYIEDLFNDLDYNLIIIFSGLFIVAGSFVRTGIPEVMWNLVAGTGGSAFRSGTSICLISIYTIVCSQLIGNVAVIIMASPEMIKLDNDTQKFGWLILAWVSTVAGNFTLAGSAANIIVAEKAFRHGSKRTNEEQEHKAAAERATELNMQLQSKQRPNYGEGTGAPRGQDDSSTSMNLSMTNSPFIFAPSTTSLISSTTSSTYDSPGNNNNNLRQSIKALEARPLPTSAKLKVTSYEHFKVCGLTTLVCITLGTLILYAESKSLGYV